MNNLIYNDDNIFARILRNEIPCDKVYEDEYALAFYDINPQMPVHILVIPKGPYINLDDFSEKGSAVEIASFFRAVGKTARIAGVEKNGYRILANNGENANQEVMHFHVHIFGGRQIRGRMIRPE